LLLRQRWHYRGRRWGRRDHEESERRDDRTRLHDAGREGDPGGQRREAEDQAMIDKLRGVTRELAVLLVAATCAGCPAMAITQGAEIAASSTFDDRSYEQQ